MTPEQRIAQLEQALLAVWDFRTQDYLTTPPTHPEAPERRKALLKVDKLIRECKVPGFQQ